VNDVAALLLTALLLLFAGLLYFVYDGYLRLLRVIHHFAHRSEPVVSRTDADRPSIAVLIAVHNEAHQIVERVENVLAQDYTEGLVQVVLASDGSTDDVCGVVGERFGGAVRVVHSAERLGKSGIQNLAVESIDTEIVLFSDADTRFAPGFLRALVAPFADESVGAVQAHLLFVPADPSAPVSGQGRYWRSELEIRQLEADLGVLAVASGACIAMRRQLWCPLDPAFGDDCVIPLDVVSQSKKVAYAAQAVAFEPAEEDTDHVVRARERMTLRNWQGTWSRPALLNPFVHPGYAGALWSHKLLRWLSPVWLIGFSFSALALPFVSTHRLFVLPAVAVALFCVLALVGAIAQARSSRVPICTSIHHFVLANVGFLRGLVRAMRGDSITRYR